MDIDPLTPAEQQALRYQMIVARYEPGCECPPCRAIELVIDEQIDT